MVKDAVNDEIKDIKQGHNDIVDKYVETKGAIRGWFASKVNAAADWLKNLVE